MISNDFRMEMIDDPLVLNPGTRFALARPSIANVFRKCHLKPGVSTVLALTRKLNQSIQIGDNITVLVTKIRGNAVSLAIQAPPSVRIMRSELEGKPPKKQSAPLNNVESQVIETNAQASFELDQTADDLEPSIRICLSTC